METNDGGFHWRNNPPYFSEQILFLFIQVSYDLPVPNNWYHRHGGLGRGLLLGTLIGLFASRANQNRAEEYEGET